MDAGAAISGLCSPMTVHENNDGIGGGLSLQSACTSVLNPVPLPQPLLSEVCSVLTPLAELASIDLSFQTIASAALPPREMSQCRPQLTSLQTRRSQLCRLPLLALRDFSLISRPQQPLDDSPNAGVTTSATATSGNTISSGHDFVDQHFSSYAHCVQQYGSLQITPPHGTMTCSTTGKPLHTPFDPHMLASTPPQDTGATSHGVEDAHGSSGNNPSHRHAHTDLDGRSLGSVTSPSWRRPRLDDWTDELLPSILSALRSSRSDSTNSQIHILTHALPLPSLSGYCFPKIVAEIQDFITPQRTTWISHWHAVSGRFNLSQLPTTPPATPAAPHEGDDYFTVRTFDSAVAVPDYQQLDIRAHTANTSFQPSQAFLQPHAAPRPAVPPSSVHVSITERYIPPTSPSEFIHMYDPSSGRSLLSDRLLELSADDGVLILIYPTKEGGRTFLKDYLGPALDPLLRRMMIVNNLGIDVCQEIGGMNAVDRLPTFEQFQSDLRQFCVDMSSNGLKRGSSSGRFGAENGRLVQLDLIHCKKQEMPLAANVWTDWWCRQEKPRIRRIFENHLRQQSGRARPASSGGGANVSATARSRLRDEPHSDGSSMTHILEVLNGVEAAARERSKSTPAKGVEVGVFVIRKREVPAAGETGSTASQHKE